MRSATGSGRRTGAWRTAAAVTAALLLLAATSGCGDDASSAGTGFHGAVLDEPYVVPQQPLTDTDGERYSLTADTDRPLTLVFFGYTACPDICQTVMASLASAMTRLDEQDRERVDVVFVTTDPARDDARALRTYLDRFDPSFIGLTGDLETIVDVGKPLAVAVEKGERLPSGGYEVTHSTQVTAIDEHDRVPILWTQGTSSAQFADDIHRLLEDAT
ncbi:SCO family protein [Nocardioides sp.]|uniref:SCO family protein n=1 Tax=Nocardioides sp. TaxID=35761 RepID=UPI002D808492|nr:SCO family protein [Nocardioides sp.]HET8960147.1 SCO family protein [Nocardioides sp.]